MIAWSSRVDDLVDHLAREYAIYDRPAIEILLSALVNCPRTASSWLILETNWYSRSFEEAWFSFGESWLPCSWPRLLARSPWRETEAEMKEMLENASDEHLFVECDYERFPVFSRLTQAPFFLQRSLRIRTKSMRARDPLRSLDKFNQDRRADELAAATRYVLEDRIHARPADPPRFIEPPDFFYFVELLQRLAPWYPDWHTIVKAFALIAVRRAYLHGRTETDESDHQAMARLLADSIPPWITKALRLLLDGPSKPQTLEKHMQLEEKTRRSGHGAHRELVRLHRHKIIRWNKLAQNWNLVDEHRAGVSAALAGLAFGRTGVPAAIQ